MDTILIIEDDKSLADGLVRALSSAQCEAQSCNNLHTARNKLAQNSYSLILLDINLPDGNGFDFLAEIKNTYNVPVIMLTANDLESDIVTALENGADDYITKPFSLAILRARVHARIRQTAENTEADSSGKKECYSLDGYLFDFEKMEFICNGVPVELSKTEQKLLRILVENAGITLSRSRLMDYVWTGSSEYVDENALSVAVKRLRDKLSAQDYIKTVYGLGYSWKG